MRLKMAEFEKTSQVSFSSVTRLNPVARVLLLGLYDKDSDFHRLNGMWIILQKIWRYIISYWKLHIKITDSQNVDPCDKNYWYGTLSLERDDHEVQEDSFLNMSVLAGRRLNSGRRLISSHVTVGGQFSSGRCSWGIENGDPITFPEPVGLNINMMPFRVGKSFKKCKLPEYLISYWEFIRQCFLSLENIQTEIGKIWYLTIQESLVDANMSQRRPGIHTEKVGRLQTLCKTESMDELGGEKLCKMINGKGYAFTTKGDYLWGGGVSRSDHVEGGIFMASNVENSCRIWDCQIMDDGLIWEHGNIEHLREFLPESTILKMNHMYWLTDRTPHESLPLEQQTYRQFFRLVTSEVSVWFEDHCTKNPLGVVPDPSITMILKGSKFDKDGCIMVK